MNYVYLALTLIALIVIEFLIGGTRLLFSLPSYGVLALAAVVSLVSFRRSKTPPSLACTCSVVGFGAYMIVRTLFSPVPYIAQSDLYLILATLIVYLLSAVHLILPKFRFNFAMTLVVLAFIHVGLGVVQYLRGEPYQLFSFIEMADYGMRATGLYICPNHLAGFLEVVSLFALAIVCWSRQNFWVKLAVGYGGIVCLVGIFLTGSRGGYLSIAIGVLAFGLLSLRALRRAHMHEIWLPITAAVVVAIAMIGAAVAFYSSHYPIQSRLSRVLTEDIRLQVWNLAVHQFKESPIIGTGAGTFRYFGRLYRPSDMVADPEYVHNDYLQLLAEFGLVGLVLGLAVAGAHFWFGYRALNYLATERPSSRHRMQSDSLALNIGALSSLVVYTIHSIFDFNLHIPANAMLFAFTLGILANPGVSFRRGTKADAWVGPGLKLLLPAAGLWIALAGLPDLPSEFYAEKARVAYRKEQYEDAIKFAQQGIRHEPTNPFLHLYQGQAYSSIAEAASTPEAAKPNFEKAVESFSRARDLYPQEQWTLVGLGAALDGLGRYSEAKPVYEEALRWNPKSAPMYLYYATHLRLAGQLDEAERMYKKSIDLYWSRAAAVGLELLAKARAEAKDNGGPPAEPTPPAPASKPSP